MTWFKKKPEPLLPSPVWVSESRAIALAALWDAKVLSGADGVRRCDAWDGMYPQTLWVVESLGRDTMTIPRNNPAWTEAGDRIIFRVRREAAIKKAEEDISNAKLALKKARGAP